MSYDEFWKTIQELRSVEPEDWQRALSAYADLQKQLATVTVERDLERKRAEELQDWINNVRVILDGKTPLEVKAERDAARELNRINGAALTELTNAANTAEAERDAMAEKVKTLTEWYDTMFGTPCEEISHQQHVEKLEAERDALKADNQRLQSEILALDLLPHTQKLRRLEAERDSAVELNRINGEALTELVNAANKAEAELSALENETGLQEERRQFNARIAQLEQERDALKAEVDAYRQGGVTEELLRRQGGFIKVGRGCVIVRGDEIDALKQELSQANTHLEAQRVATYQAVEREQRVKRELTQARQAIGLMTTLKGDLEMNVNDPLGMMQQVHAHVMQQLHAAQAREGQLREALEHLHDTQNGPPLEKYRLSWEEAMQKTEKALKEAP